MYNITILEIQIKMYIFYYNNIEENHSYNRQSTENY